MEAKYGKLKVGDVIFLEGFSDKGMWIVESINHNNNVALLLKIQPDGVGVIKIMLHLILIKFRHWKTIEI